MKDRLERALTEVKAEMTTPETESPTSSSTEEGTTTVKKKKTTAKKKTPTAKKTAAPKKAKAVKDENAVSLKEVAKEFKLEARIARRILRKAGIENPGRWSWPKDSGALKKVRDLFGKDKE